MIRKLALITCVLLICSCSKDETVASNEELPLKSDVVTFDINSSPEWTPDIIVEGVMPASKGEKRPVPTRSETLPMDCEGYEGTQIYMFMTEEDNLENNHVQTIDTRAGEGSPVLGVYAFKSSSEEYVPSPDAEGSVFMDNLNLSTYGTETNPYMYWPGNGTWLKFFAYMPYADSVEGLSVATSGNQAKFTYTVPTDLSKQCDVMDGVSGLIAGDVTDVVEISLEHVMSQIKVKAGTLDEGVINSITFKNIYNAGDRIMASDSWTIAGSKSDYVQTFDPGIKPASGAVIGEEMYLLPQTLRDDAVIEISMTITSQGPTGDNRVNTYILSKKLNEFTAAWQKDKIYTYVISTPEEVEVSVTDEIEGNVKKNLRITNSGMSSAYIRAAITGNWVIPGGDEPSEDDVIVADWTDADGTFEWGDKIYTDAATAKANNGWYRHTDGYYYLLDPVAKGAQAETLFKTYTLTSSPVAGAVLDLTILVQAVLPADMPYAWPDIYNILNN